MDNYLDIANSPGMWLACSAIIVVVFFQAVRLTVISLRAGQEIGMTKQQLMSAFRSGFTTALVPSIAILLGLALLIPRLGLPFPWMRLSVIGSVTYELMAAGFAASELGLEGLTGDFDAVAFTTAVWVMSMGAIVGLVVVAFFTPKIKSLKDKVAGGDEGWMKVMTAAAFFGAVGYMVAQPVGKILERPIAKATMMANASPLMALLGGFFCMALLGIIIQVGKQNWLKEWALALAIIGGMAVAGLAFYWFGIGAGV
ncbi:MAG: DUF5058 family protein [Deltaproteobacteria bacterium]|nr:DUF5058 family protein [Candidatus Zymogenaceae bacterium]